MKAMLFLLLACAAAPPEPVSPIGLYVAEDKVLELHRGPEGVLRGYLRNGERIAALSIVGVREGQLRAGAVYDDGTKADLAVELRPGPVVVLEGVSYRRTAVEKPADDAVRREIVEAYARLARAVETKDHAAFQALRVPEFATIPPDGTPRTGPSMAERARGMLQRIQPPITTTNDLLELTVRGDHAIATVRQKFTRMQGPEGELHKIHTEVTQRETWTRTPGGWKLLFVDEVRDPVTLDNGQRVN